MKINIELETEDKKQVYEACLMLQSLLSKPKVSTEKHDLFNLNLPTRIVNALRGNEIKFIEQLVSLKNGTPITVTREESDYDWQTRTRTNQRLVDYKYKEFKDLKNIKNLGGKSVQVVYEAVEKWMKENGL